MYNYEEQKEKIFSESGMEVYIKVRDNIQKLLKVSGAVSLGMATHGMSGDSWLQMVCVDRLVEIGEIVEIEQGVVWGQHRVFVSPNRGMA